MGAAALQEDVRPRIFLVQWQPLQSSTAFLRLPSLQHPLLMHQSRWTLESALENLRAHAAADEPQFLLFCASAHHEMIPRRAPDVGPEGDRRTKPC